MYRYNVDRGSPVNSLTAGSRKIRMAFTRGSLSNACVIVYFLIILRLIALIVPEQSREAVRYRGQAFAH